MRVFLFAAARLLSLAAVRLAVARDFVRLERNCEDRTSALRSSAVSLTSHAIPRGDQQALLFQPSLAPGQVSAKFAEYHTSGSCCCCTQRVAGNILHAGIAVRKLKNSAAFSRDWISQILPIWIGVTSGRRLRVRMRHNNNSTFLFGVGDGTRLRLDVLGSPVVANHQCACSTASTVVIPAIREPVIAISAGMPRGNSRLISEARKIAATGRAMTK